MRGMQAKVYLPRELPWGILEGHDFLRENLWLVLVTGELAHHENSSVRGEQVAVFRVEENERVVSVERIEETAEEAA